MKLMTAGLLILLSSMAMAEESEFQDKMKEDMADAVRMSIADACGMTQPVKTSWDKKLGANPRESGVTTLCSSAAEALGTACSDSPAVKGKMKGVKEIKCVQGKGPLSFGLAANVVTFKYDTAFNANNPAGQRDDLVKKIVKNFEK